VDRPLVIQAEGLAPAAEAWLDERCDLRRLEAGSPEFERALPEARALVVRTYTKVDAALLERAPNLEVVARAGVGLANIDLDACRARNVAVVHTPAANTQAVVELVLAFLLDALRPRVFLDRALEPARWSALRRELTAERQLSDCLVGILGLGRVGSALARALRALSVRTIYNDIRAIPEPERHGAEPVAFEALLAESDVVTLHVDARPENRHLIDSDACARLKADAIVINTSRGFVVDDAALAELLRHNPRAQAILDVHDPEPIAPENPLIPLPNAHLAPHIGAATRTAHEQMSWVVRDVWRVLQGEAPEHPAIDALARDEGRAARGGSE